MINQVILGGRLVKDATCVVTKTNQTIVNFVIANNQKYKDIERSVFIEATMFGNYAKAMQPYLLKGVALDISGKLVQEVWEKDGENFSKIKINVSEIDFRNYKNNEELGTKTKNEQNFEVGSEEGQA